MPPSISMPLAEESKNRWSAGKWITSKKFQAILRDIEKLVDEISNRDLPTDYFTPHDSSHCIAVEKMAKAIISKISLDSKELDLTELEKFILFVAVWMHDIGMIESVAQEYLKEEYSSNKKREKHEYASALYTSYNKDFEKIFIVREDGFSKSLFKSYTDAINIIIKYHRRKFSLDHCPEFLYIKDQKIRSRLIACFLRLADTLHVDSSRYNRKLFDILQIGNFDRTARLHWLKSYVVSSVYFDIAKQVIIVSVNLPEVKNDLSERRRIEENAERLKFIIKENIQEDLEDVKEILKAYELRFFESVDICINYCPGYKDEKREEILGILDDLDIVMSPNTSKVIRKSLDSIRALIGIDFKNYEHFHNQARQLIHHLDDVIKTRPCHVGLERIISLLKKIFASYMSNEKFGNTPNSKIKDVKEKLKEMIEKIQSKRDDAKKKSIRKHLILLKEKDISSYLVSVN